MGENPFARDVVSAIPEPTTLVIFGATGDLTARKLLPAIYNLAVGGHLPERFRLIGVAAGTRVKDFRAHAESSLREFSRTTLDRDVWSSLREQISFLSGDFSDPALYARVAEATAAAEEETGLETRKIFYLATAPRFFGPIARELGRVGLGRGSVPENTLVVEKPFGTDLASAMELNAVMSSGWDEHQMLRIDHYLGKETVQNLLYFRFTNGIFEPVWNRRYVDQVQITVAEDIGIGQRAGYYNRSGAIRDVIQNHVMQIVALMGMEPPSSFDADLIHAEKVKLFRAIERPTPETIPMNVVRGQYEAGWIGGERVAGYREEAGIPEDSTTETYVAMKLKIDNWRWSGVPFYLRTGKRMPVRLAEIAVIFRPVPHLPLRGTSHHGVRPNTLVFQLQPNEGVTMTMVTKVPGFTDSVRPVRMDFQYGTSFMRESPEAYEHILRDALLNDRTRFTTSEEIEATWRVIDPILDVWQSGDELGPYGYDAGTAGPAEADELLARDGHAWRRL